MSDFLRRHDLQTYKYSVSFCDDYITPDGLPGIPPLSGLRCTECSSISADKKAIEAHYRRKHPKPADQQRYVYNCVTAKYVSVPPGGGAVQLVKIAVPSEGPDTSAELHSPIDGERRKKLVNNLGKVYLYDSNACIV